MEELEVLIKEQQQIKSNIDNYSAMIAGYSQSLKDIEFKHIDSKTDYQTKLEEYDKIKTSTDPKDLIEVKRLKFEMSKIRIDILNSKSNLVTVKGQLKAVKEQLKLEQLKNKSLDIQIGNHPETKLVSAKAKEDIINDNLQYAKQTKSEIKKLLEGNIKDINDIPDNLRKELLDSNPTYKHYEKTLSKLKEDLSDLEKVSAPAKFTEPLKKKIQAFESKKISFALGELNKADLAADVIIDSCYSHIKDLTLEKAKAYNDIDAIRNGTYVPEDKEDTENSNAANNNNSDNSSNSENSKDDQNNSSNLPAKQGFFSKFKSAFSNFIEKVKNRFASSKDKDKDKEEEKDKEDNSEQNNNSTDNDKDKDKDKEKQKENTSNRHYEEKDFAKNETYKNDMDEFLKNFEEKTRKDVENFEKNYDENEFGNR